MSARRPFALTLSPKRSNARRAPAPPDELLEFRAGQILRLLEIAAERGCSVYTLMQATELDAQEVLDAIRILQRGGISIRPELDYAHDLELLFILETRLPKIGGGR